MRSSRSKWPGTLRDRSREPNSSRSRELERFLTDLWESGGWEEAEPDRVLATVLFTDIVGSSERAAELGDRAWHDVLDRHRSLVRRQLVRFRGRELDTAGDGFFASFDGPARFHTGARVAALADAGEVLVSSTVRDLVAGSRIGFEGRGTHDLKGVGEWRVYALVPET